MVGVWLLVDAVTVSGHPILEFYAGLVLVGMVPVNWVISGLPKRNGNGAKP